MHDYTSKQLYMANGGQKLYINKDGFGDIYSATPEEEAEWAIEVVANALVKIENEQNHTTLEFAVNDLIYHKYENTEALLLEKIPGAGAERQIAFASLLWKLYRYEKSFDILYQNLQQRRNESLNNVFTGLNDFKDNVEARSFIIGCLDGNDEALMTKAKRTLAMWSWQSGMTLLKENNLVDLLGLENKHNSTFNDALNQVKQILK